MGKELRHVACQRNKPRCDGLDLLALPESENKAGKGGAGTKAVLYITRFHVFKHPYLTQGPKASTSL